MRVPGCEGTWPIPVPGFETSCCQVLDQHTYGISQRVNGSNVVFTQAANRYFLPCCFKNLVSSRLLRVWILSLNNYYQPTPGTEYQQTIIRPSSNKPVHNVHFGKYVYLPTEQAETYLKRCVLINYSTYICLCLFGWKVNMIKKKP